MASPFCGSLPAIDAREHQRDAGGGGIRRASVPSRTGAAPNRCALVIRGDDPAGGRDAAGAASPGAGFSAAGQVGDDAGPPAPLRRQPSPQVAMRGPSLSSSARQRSLRAAALSSQEDGIHGEKHGLNDSPHGRLHAPRRARVQRSPRPGPPSYGPVLVLSSDCFCKTNYPSFLEACVAVSRPYKDLMPDPPSGPRPDSGVSRRRSACRRSKQPPLLPGGSAQR